MPMTAGVPKPMIPMANQPLMANTVRLLARHGFTELIANLHYHGDQIRAYFRDGSDFGVSMHYSPRMSCWVQRVESNDVPGFWMTHL